MVGCSSGGRDCSIESLEEGGEGGIDLFKEGGDERGELLGGEGVGIVALADNELFQAGEFVTVSLSRSVGVDGSAVK